MDHITGLEMAVDLFLARMAFGENTARTYRCGLSAFLSFCQKKYRGASKEAASVGIEELDTACLEAFSRWLVSSRGRGYSPRTASVYLTAAKRFLLWLDAQNALPPTFSLSQALHRLMVYQGQRRQGGYIRRPVDLRVPLIVLYYDEMELPDPVSRQAIQQRLMILRARATVHLLYATAARVSEIASLTRQQVQDGKASEIMITGKGGRQRLLFLSPQAQKAISMYIQERRDSSPWLFIPHNGTRPGHLGRGALWRIVKDAAQALKLSSQVSPHMFRHFRAIQLLNNGMPLESVQAFLGHGSIATTRTVYAPTMVATLQEHLERYGVSPAEAIRKIEGQEIL